MACNGCGIVWAPEWLAFGEVRRERRLTPRRVKVVIDFLGEAAKLWQA